MKNENYYERLQKLKLFSLQRRRERYSIIYVWKIIENICPNLQNNPINTFIHDRKGRLCKIPTLNTKSSRKIQTIKENTLPIRGPKLFNTIPKELRNITEVNTLTFKRKLDTYLYTLRDEPPIDGYYRTNTTNSMIDIKYNQCTGLSTA